MFTTIKAKKMVFPLIGTLLVICSFSMLGCSGKVSELDKLEMSHQLEINALESKNARLIAENTEVKKKNKDIEEHVSRLIAENAELKKKNKDIEEGSSQEETPPSLLLDSFSFGGKLNVGDKLTFDDEVSSSSGIWWIAGRENEISNTKYDHPIIYFPTKGAWIELKNGTRYICASPTGCIVNWANSIIVEGTIEIYYITLDPPPPPQKTSSVQFNQLMEILRGFYSESKKLEIIEDQVPDQLSLDELKTLLGLFYSESNQLKIIEDHAFRVPDQLSLGELTRLLRLFYSESNQLKVLKTLQSRLTGHYSDSEFKAFTNLFYSDSNKLEAIRLVNKAGK